VSLRKQSFVPHFYFLCINCLLCLLPRYCGDCTKTKNLCDDCVGARHKKAKNQSHTVVDMAVHLVSSTATSPATATAAIVTCCKIHGEPLKLHCVTCDKTICMECGSFEHGSHKKVKIADLTAESREAILHQVECTASATKQLGEAKVQLQACCGEVDATADASEQAIDAFVKRVRQATTTAADAVKVKVDGLRSRKLGVGDPKNKTKLQVAWRFRRFIV
jgi:hypothetical protein